MLVLQGRLDLAVLADPVDLRGQEARGQRGQVALQGHRVHQGQRVQVGLVQQDRLDLQDLVERQVQVHLDQVGRVVLLGQLEQGVQEYQGRVVLRGQVGQLGRVELALAVHQGQAVLQE